MSSAQDDGTEPKEMDGWLFLQLLLAFLQCEEHYGESESSPGPLGACDKNIMFKQLIGKLAWVGAFNFNFSFLRSL